MKSRRMFVWKVAAPVGVVLGAAMGLRAWCDQKPLVMLPGTAPKTEVYDVCVVGGGIVGLATAREILERFPKMRVALVEKESEVAHHQTGMC